jgi:hypothetical protein
LIALLDKEFRWKTNESAVTGKLYTAAICSYIPSPIAQPTNRPVTWSLE